MVTTSSGCGIKNSLCPNGTTSSTTIKEDPLEYRFCFVDGRTGLWTVPPDSAEHYYYDNITCPLGGIVVFRYPVVETQNENENDNDIVQVAGFDDWDHCRVHNLTVAASNTPSTTTTTLLSPRSLSGNNNNKLFRHVSYYYHCSQPNTTVYLTSSVPGHCENRQKVMIHTTSENETTAFDPLTGNWTMHVRSLERVLRLLGHQQQQSQGQDQDNANTRSNLLDLLPRGYQTEALANTTTELIWCALDHCPDFAHNVYATATKEECESVVFTLLGYVSRKRPIPQWEVAEKYYQQAIERTQNSSKTASHTDSNNNSSYFCTAQSYLTQLYLSKGDWENATSAIATLCTECSGSTSSIQGRQQQQPDTDTALLFVQQAEQQHWAMNVSGDVLDFGSVCNGAVKEQQQTASPIIAAAGSCRQYTASSSSWLPLVITVFLWVLFSR